MIIYKIVLPKSQDRDKFADFIRDEYFPAVHKGSTRIGMVTSLVLLEHDDDMERDNDLEFYIHVGWSGLKGQTFRMDDEEVLKKFKIFEADIQRIGSFSKIAVWEGASH